MKKKKMKEENKRSRPPSLSTFLLHSAHSESSSRSRQENKSRTRGITTHFPNEREREMVKSCQSPRDFLPSSLRTSDDSTDSCIVQGLCRSTLP